MKHCPRKSQVIPMTDFKRFSKKQRRVLSWWNQPNCPYDAIVCDGAVRSGKTLCMSLSFVAWAMCRFKSTGFAICGKTLTSVRRNLTDRLIRDLSEMGFEVSEKLSKNYFEVSFLGVTNRFYIFGGKDESSASLIQGMTLGGVLLDEVVLLPRSFVEQALARCSLEGAKLWFNCNPENPAHWFYTEWIKKAKEKHALYIHFDMTDNPSLSKRVLERYKSLYSGAFYDRFVLGKWCAVTGVVYPMFEETRHIVTKLPHCTRYAVSCDYGTVNPSSFGLWGYSEGVWYRIREYYYSSKKEGISRTDEEHYQALCDLLGEIIPEAVVVDPSAASFIECIRRHGRYTVLPAKNDVISGIRRVQDALKSGVIRFSDKCRDSIREFSLYRWDERSGSDSVIKENDHAMDDIRYFVTRFVAEDSSDGFIALSINR